MKKTTLILFLCISAFLGACNEEPKSAVILINQEECKPDSVIVHDTVYMAPHTKKTKGSKTNAKPKSITVDTLAIIEKYKASLGKDSAHVAKIDSSSRDIYVFNKWSLNVTNVYAFPEIKRTEAKRGFYAGFGTSFSKDVFNSIYVGGLYKTKKDEIIKVDVGLSNDGDGNFQPYIGTGIYFKIK